MGRRALSACARVSPVPAGRRGLTCRQGCDAVDGNGDGMPVLAASWPGVVALVAANLLPLGGVLWLRWDLGLVLLLYWAESAILLAFNLLKMARMGVAGLAAAAFFVVHAGMFMGVHLLFLVALFHPLHGRTMAQAAGTLGPSLLGLVVSHGVSFVHNTVRRGERPANPGQVMAGFYVRVFVMQLTIILGGGLMQAFGGSPVWALALLVLLKTAVDLGGHLAERRRHLPMPGPTPTS